MSGRVSRFLLLGAFFILALMISACGSGMDESIEESVLEMDRAIRLLEDGHLDQAYNAFGAVIASDPGNAEAYARRGFIQLALGNTTAGIANINRALEIDSEFALAHNYKGLAFAMNGIHDQAILEFTRAAELAPGLVDAFVNRGKVYLEMSDGESALADLDVALSLDPESVETLLIRAQTHITLGDISRAEADLERVLSLPAGERTITLARQILSRIR